MSLNNLLTLIGGGSYETLYMVFLSGFIAVILGIPLGILLLITQKDNLWEQNLINRMTGFIVNVFRSIPFIILMIAVIPFTRLVVGTSIGTTAAIVPLTIAAIPFMARLTESSLMSVQSGLIEAALAMGATTKQIVFNILLPEALPSMIQGITLMTITLVSFSAMAGAVAGGGLGDVAIQYGYQRFDTTIMIITVVVLVVLVQALQWIGDKLTIKLKHQK